MKSQIKILILLMICLISISTFAQNRTIKGLVNDDKQNPVVGANIVVDKTTIGTVTDLNGKFSLNVPINTKSITISFIGMTSKKILINNLSYYKIKLEENSEVLDELVVVGYGIQKKSDLTGAVSSVDASSITGRTVSIEQGLQGRVSGVQITKSEASPDGGISMVIRGSNSIVGGTEPLYVIDGIPISGKNTMIRAGYFDIFGGTGEEQTMTQPSNMLSFLNPSDIASVEVLKDASATAIYGSRASNGVVLITTKKGVEGQTKINFNASYDVAEASRKWDLLDASEYAEQQNTRQLIQSIMGDNKTYEQAILDLPFPGTYNGQSNFNWTPNDNAGGDGSYSPSPEDYSQGNMPSTNWQDVVLRKGISQKYSLTISGGNDKIKFYVGAGADNINGIIEGSKFHRYSLNSNLDAKLLKKLSFTNSTNASYTLSNRSQTGNIQSGDMRGVMMAAVNFDPTQLMSGYRYQMENGLLAPSDDPYTAATSLTDKNTVYSVMDNVALNIDIIKGLKVKITGGARFNLNVRDYYIPRTSNRYWEANGQGYASYGNNVDMYLINENLVFYNTTIGKHKIDLTAGYTQEQSSENTHSVNTKGFLNDYNTYHVLGTGSIYYAPYSDYIKTESMSYLGRVNYIYDDRYLLTVTFRADGSSKFGKNNKWGYFPSAAIAWRISQEEFLKNNDLISNLKLRLSYGETGNQGVAPYQSQSALVSGNYPYNGNLSSTYQYGTIMPNPNLKWEKTAQYNAGLDLGFFNNRLSITADFYKKKTSNLLQRMNMAANTGFSSIYKNAGSISNTGAELSVTGVISKNDFYWSLTGNWSTNKSKVTSLGELTSYPGYHVWGWSNFPFPVTVGHSLGEVWGYKMTKVMKTWEDRKNCAIDNPNMRLTNDPETGQEIYAGKLGEYDFEKDADGKMKKQVIGNTNPDFIFGLNSQMSYKNFDLSFALAGAIGQDILNLQMAPGFDYTWRVHQYADNRWIPEVKDKNGKVVLQDNGKSGYILEDPYGSDYGEYTYSTQIEDGSWIKLKNITLDYTYKFKTSNYFISSIRPYITLNNVFCIDSYSGMDPEASAFGQDPTRRGVAFSEYPMSFSTTFGVNVTF